MEIEFIKGEFFFNKELNHLDKLAREFSKLLTDHEIGHVFVSGYVAILFGRNRSSEYIDLICERVSINRFIKLWNDCTKKFECIITDDPKKAYHEYLLNETAIRFARKNEIIPNIELKFPLKDLDKWTLNNKLRVLCNDAEIYISPIELQIAYKLFLSSEKDIEDAEYLYILFKEKLDMEILQYFLKELKQEEKFQRDVIGTSQD
jgi:hypothetical protein